METAQHRDRLAPAEITMFQISEAQESPAFNGRRSFLTLRGCRRLIVSRNETACQAGEANIVSGVHSLSAALSAKGFSFGARR
jgi:hypothetical protein